MVDPAQTAKGPDDGPAALGVPARPAKAIVIGLAVIILGVLAWFIVGQVREGAREDRWDDLHRLQEQQGVAQENHRDWTYAQATDKGERDAYIAKLEKFLADHSGDDVVAAHVHMLLFDLEQVQILTLSPTATKDDLKKRWDKAEAHLKAVIEKYPDFPLNWEIFKPTHQSSQGFSSTAKLLLARLQENRRWEEENGLEVVATDGDVEAVVRTTKGDLRLRFYASASPALVKSFVDRACRGDWDGTAFFAAEDRLDEKFVRAGDARTKDAEPKEEARLEWGNPGPDDPLPYEDGRYRILHVKGTVSAWNDGGDKDDERDQFLVVTTDSPDLNYAYTPFAKVDAGSFATLDRIAGTETFKRKDPAIVSDTKRTGLQNQFVKPVRIVKVLVYEKGELKSCHDAAKVRATEKKIATLVADEDLVKDEPPPPPAPPAPPAPPTPAPTPPPAMDEAPMDGGMGG
jgi:cyclophilin family peptidyl-prolyl cis-trans isomerase